jgi:hypothetical protein
VTQEHESNLETTIDVMYVKGNRSAVGKFAVTADVLQNGSWLASRPAVSGDNSILDRELKAELVAAFEKTGFLADKCLLREPRAQPAVLLAERAKRWCPGHASAVRRGSVRQSM